MTRKIYFFITFFPRAIKNLWSKVTHLFKTCFAPNISKICITQGIPCTRGWPLCVTYVHVYSLIVSSKKLRLVTFKTFFLSISCAKKITRNGISFSFIWRQRKGETNMRQYCDMYLLYPRSFPVLCLIQPERNCNVTFPPSLGYMICAYRPYI